MLRRTNPSQKQLPCGSIFQIKPYRRRYVDPAAGIDDYPNRTLGHRNRSFLIWRIGPSGAKMTPTALWVTGTRNCSIREFGQPDRSLPNRTLGHRDRSFLISELSHRERRCLSPHTRPLGPQMAQIANWVSRTNLCPCLLARVGMARTYSSMVTIAKNTPNRACIMSDRFTEERPGGQPGREGETDLKVDLLGLGGHLVKLCGVCSCLVKTT